MAIPDNLKKTFETDYCGKRLVVETGYIAEQANGAVMLRLGDTAILVTAVASKAPREGIDFFPLTCDYEEKLYAVGRIPGSFPRREGRPSEAATITSRMIDRPMRPLFPKDFRNDVQIVATVLSSDQEQDPATLAVTGASCALQISGIPHGGPVACVRVGMLDGQLLLNPTLTQINESELDLIVAGTWDAIVMVEAGAHQISEHVMLQALRMAHDEIRKLVEFQRSMHDAIGKPTMSYPSQKVSPDITAAVHEYVASRVGSAARNPDKASREAAIDQLQAETVSALEERVPRRAFRHRQGVRVRGQEGRSRSDPRRGHPSGRTPYRRDPAHLGRGRRASAHARVGPLHPRADAGALGRHDRFWPGSAENRRPRPREFQAVHAPVQLPAVLGGGGASAALTRPSRDRPRRTCRARGAQRDARRGEIPVRGAHRHRDPLEQWLDVDGIGVRFVPRAHGRGRSAHRARCRYRDGPHHRRRQRARGDPQRHPGHGGRARRHGLQGCRARRPASPRCRWTARSRASAGT